MSQLCRKSALRFLKVRPRSVFELRTKLSGKGFESQAIDATIEYLKSIDLLNDRVLAGIWIRYRLARPFGFKRIITELKAKGIDEDLIAEAVGQAKEEYDEPDVILSLAKRRAERLVGIDPVKKKKRVFDFLLRRGFSVDMAMKAIKKI